MRLAVVTAVVLLGCGSDPAPPTRPTVFGGDRPVELQLPLLTEGERYPLVVILHGFGASGFVQQAYFGLSDFALDHDSFVLAPDGTANSMGKLFWNAGPECCDFEGQNPDDVGYLGGMIDDVIANWPVDVAQVRVIGHSNGGFMSYRLACERADVITSIVVLAGDAVTGTCAPTSPVHVAHLHGTADDTVPFAGAQPAIDQWSAHNGCTATLTPGATHDLDRSVPGAETEVSVAANCSPDGQVELWKMTGSGHIPMLLGSFQTAINQWWITHARK